MSQRSLFMRRLVLYIIGLFILALGIAFSIKSQLGVSPVSSLPYAVSLITGWSVGNATIVIYALFLAAQALLLRKQFKLNMLMQLVCAFLFGYFTDFSLWLLQLVPEVSFYPVQFIYLIIGIILAALGLFIYMPANLFPLPYDGLTKVIADKTKGKFSVVKMYCDITNVGISALISLAFLGNLGSVREGTILAAFAVGRVLNFFMNRYGKFIYQFLGGPEEAETSENDRAAGE